MMTRRTFLRVLGSAAVAAAATQILPIQPALSAASGPLWDTTAAGPLTLDMLRRTYESCVIGERGPNVMVLSQSTARMFGLVYDVEFEVAA